MINETKLDFWMKNNLNVMLRGRKGTGKSAMIIEAAERNNLKWKYFSASTMDVFTDFIGVPRATKDENGVEYLDFIRPRDIEHDEIEFLFFDEFNRCKPKLLNSVMELIQFKSINGKKFKNLKMVWVAINPKNDEDSEEEYLVETLDPAHIDRFHVIVNVDDAPSTKFFEENFGENGLIACAWWKSLDKEFRNLISPRRLEYALRMYELGGDLRDVLDQKINISQLVNQLKNGSFTTRLKQLYEEKNEENTIKSLKNENFFLGTYNTILKSNDYIDYFMDYFPKEKFNKELISNETFRKQLLSSKEKCVKHKDTIIDIVNSDAGPFLVIKELRDALKEYKLKNLNTVEEIYNTYILEKASSLNSKEERENATFELSNIEIESITEMSSLEKLLFVNCVIAAKTFGSFWTSTNEIFERVMKNISDQVENRFTPTQNLDPNIIFQNMIESIMTDNAFIQNVGKKYVGRFEKRIKKEFFIV